MHREHGFRSGFGTDEYSSKGSPYRGKISPGRSLYTDERYGDEDLYFDEEDLEEDQQIWDLHEMGIDHPEGQGLVGDELNLGPHYGKGPKGYTRSDQRILEDVCEALKADPLVDAREIEVVVDNGLVVLKGQVKGRAMKKLAENSVENLPGVKDVRNELKPLT